MKHKLTNPAYEPIKAADAKQTVKEYLEGWIEIHGKANLRPSTMFSYKSEIKNHIVLYIGNVPLTKVTAPMLDNLFQTLFDTGLSQSSVKYVQRVLGVSLEAARKYHYIEFNPARDILTKFGKSGKTPDPYTIDQMQKLLAYTEGTNLEMIVMLGGLYGLRRGEMVGLRWRNIDRDNRTMNIVEQIPFHVPKGTKTITEMAPTKSNDRLLPITDRTLSYFIREKEKQHRQKELAALSGEPYYDNDLVICNPDGSCLNAETITRRFPEFLHQKGLFQAFTLSDSGFEVYALK